MPKKKIKQKKIKRKIGVAKIANFSTKSFLSNAISNYKKNKELNKIKAIKLEKLQEKNQILKERKDLIEYFKNSYKNLKDNGILMLDAFFSSINSVIVCIIFCSID